MSRGSSNDFLLGFLIGFFLGCIGVVVAAFLKPEYLTGAVAGVVASVVVGCAAGGILAVTGPGVLALQPADQPAQIERITFGAPEPAPQLPWGLMCALLAGGTVAAGGVAGALYMASQDDDEGHEPGYDEPR